MAACVDDTSTSRSSLQLRPVVAPEAGAGEAHGGAGDDDDDEQAEGDGRDGPVAPGRDPHAVEARSSDRPDLAASGRTVRHAGAGGPPRTPVRASYGSAPLGPAALASTTEPGHAMSDGEVR